MLAAKPGFSNLPGEVQDCIISYLEGSELASVLIVNSVLSRIAIRRLYRSISLCSIPSRIFCARVDYPALNDQSLPLIRSLKCLSSIARSPSLALQVRSLTVEFNHLDASALRRLQAADGFSEDLVPLANVYALLRRALREMVNLSSLSIALSLAPRRNRRGLIIATNTNGMAGALGDGVDLATASPYVKLLANPYSMLEDAPFRLTTLETNAPFDSSLCRILLSQPSLTELTLRSVHPSNWAPNRHTAAFGLPPTALPRLQQFRAIHAPPSLLQEFISGRPVHSVYIPLHPLSLAHPMSSSIVSGANADTEFPCLNVLSASSVPITRLTVFSFDARFLSIVNLNETPNLGDIAREPTLVARLFDRVADVTTELESLQVIVMMSTCRLEELEDAAPLLAPYKKLKSITYMASADTQSGSNNSRSGAAPPQSRYRLMVQEKRIVDAWAKSCPSLRTVVLPRGQVWFKRTCTTSKSIAHCCCCGTRRQHEAQLDRKDANEAKYKSCGRDVQESIEGAVGECGNSAWFCEREVALTLSPDSSSP